MKTELPTPSLINGSTRYSSPSDAPPTPVTNGSTLRPSIASLEARVRRYNSDIDARSARFRAAVLLLAAIEYGRNIDALSHRTGYPRNFVAQCARRLTDNGVWTPEGFITEWSPDDEASGAFWNDVAVAEGKLCRRRTADGQIEWAPPGFWNKSYEFVDTRAKSQFGAVYRNATVATNAKPVADDTDQDDDDDDGEPDGVVPPSSTAPTTNPPDTAPPAPEPVAPADQPRPEPKAVIPETSRMRQPVPVLPSRPVRPAVRPHAELFPDTVWIG